ncbi:no match found [Pseudoscourfieldia marina]
MDGDVDAERTPNPLRRARGNRRLILNFKYRGSGSTSYQGRAAHADHGVSVRRRENERSERGAIAVYAIAGLPPPPGESLPDMLIRAAAVDSTTGPPPPPPPAVNSGDDLSQLNFACRKCKKQQGVFEFAPTGGASSSKRAGIAFDAAVKAADVAGVEEQRKKNIEITNLCTPILPIYSFPTSQQSEEDSIPFPTAIT